MAVDIWILEVRDPSQAARGLASAFGLPREKSEAIIAAVPCRVKRDVPAHDGPRYQKKLQSIGATISWGPAGESSPPPARVKPPPNDPPDELVDVPDVPTPFSGAKTKLYGTLAVAGFIGVLGLAALAPGLSSGEAGWPTVIAAGASLMALSCGAFGLTLAWFRLSVAALTLPLACGILGAAACVLILVSSEPDPRARLARVATLRAEVLGGQAPEARVFLGGNGTFETADAARSRSFVESLYTAGARRVLVIDEDGNGEAEWIAIDMPVLPERRSAISGAVRSYAGEDFNQIPGELATPSNARHWVLPVDIH